MKTEWTKEKIEALSKEILEETLGHTCDLTPPGVIFDALKELASVLKEHKKIDILLPREVVAYPSYLAAKEGEGGKMLVSCQSVDVQWVRVLCAWNVAGKRILGYLDPLAEKILRAVQKLICTEIYVSDEKVIIIDSPEQQHLSLNSRGQRVLHSATGPALLMRDGKAVFALEGIKVPRWLVETPADKLEKKKVLALTDVDQRRVAIQKMGILRLCEDSKVVDAKGDYQLVDMQDVLGSKSLYLRMKNPSNGQIHLEGVDNELATVQQALNWRAQRDSWNPCSLDGEQQDNGCEDQVQQGDVLFERTSLPIPLDACPGPIPVSAIIRHTISLGKVWEEKGKYEAGMQSEGFAKSVHPEHHDTPCFPEGTYGIWKVREFDHVSGILRSVED